ncbi:MAG: HEAT repeat domain-containing protein [Planctomycetes bacterium]|nr:HEAT repeat domain-containing protein [Planctomycetota bacterium]
MSFHRCGTGTRETGGAVSIGRRSTRRRSVLLGICAVAFGSVPACTRNPLHAKAAPQPASAPKPPAYTPRLAEFRKLMEAEPKPLEGPRLGELRDLMETAFTSQDQRLRKMAKSSLLEAAECDAVLEMGLTHERAEVRSNAAFELGNRKCRRAVPLLLRRMKDETSAAEPRFYLADALCRLDNLAALPELLEAMEGALAQRAAGTAITLLDRCGRSPGSAPTYAALRAGLRLLYREWCVLGRVPVVEPVPLDAVARARLGRCFVDMVGKELRPVDEARYVLSRMGAPAVSLLERVLDAEELYLRQHGLEILRRMGLQSSSVASKVRPLLGDPQLRGEAAATLGEIGAIDAVPDLLGLLEDPDIEVQCAAAGAFGPLAAHGAVPQLEALLSRQETPMDLRVRAAFSLAMLRPHGPGFPFLRARLQQGDYHAPTVRELLDRVIESW